MRKKKRKHDLRLFRNRRAYTLTEISDMLGIHFGSVERWHRQGLISVDRTRRPLLFMGEAIKTFIRQKARKRRHPLKPGEFFCISCKLVCRSPIEKIRIEITEKPLGKTGKLAFIRGVCEICGQSLTLLYSDHMAKIWFKNTQTLLGQKEVLTETSVSPINVGKTKGENHENECRQ